ncbi:MAG: branched-chain amino acid transaminase [Candidatus Peribacteraceae bacterium]|nr:branched-chain amino acid transaminase [Candidatus Peribacteraceae bacterium]
MEPTKYIWMDGTFVPWAKATVHVLVHGLHYGSAVFEGVRCYETPKGPAVFRLKEHTDRLLYSAKAIDMTSPFSRDELMEATKELIRRNKIKECYIRPILFYGYGKMGLRPGGAPVQSTIACWPWGSYLGHEAVRVKTSKHIRLHPRSVVPDAKVSGHYVNSIMASLEVVGDDRYDESLFLDFEGNIAEGPGENIFFVRDGKLITPPHGMILPGITRDSVVSLAKDRGLTVTEKTVKPEDLASMDECFFTGTAAEVTAVVSIDGKKIGNGKIGPVTTTLKKAYLDAVHGKDPKHQAWCAYVG